MNSVNHEEKLVRLRAAAHYLAAIVLLTLYGGEV